MINAKLKLTVNIIMNNPQIPKLTYLILPVHKNSLVNHSEKTFNNNYSTVIPILYDILKSNNNFLFEYHAICLANL